MVNIKKLRKVAGKSEDLVTFRATYVNLFSNLMHNFFIKSIVFLYMFRALIYSSSGGLNCIYTACGS